MFCPIGVTSSHASAIAAGDSGRGRWERKGDRSKASTKAAFRFKREFPRERCPWVQGLGILSRSNRKEQEKERLRSRIPEGRRERRGLKRTLNQSSLFRFRPVLHLRFPPTPTEKGPRALSFPLPNNEKKKSLLCCSERAKAKANLSIPPPSSSRSLQLLHIHQHHALIALTDCHNPSVFAPLQLEDSSLSCSVTDWSTGLRHGRDESQR